MNDANLGAMDLESRQLLHEEGKVFNSHDGKSDTQILYSYSLHLANFVLTHSHSFIVNGLLSCFVSV